MSNVIEVDFSRRHHPVGSLVRHPRFGICPVLEAHGHQRLLEVVEDGDEYDWFKRRVELVPVNELEAIETELDNPHPG